MLNIVLNTLNDLWYQFTSIIRTMEAADIIDIIFVAVITYQLLKLVRETRAVQLLKGIAALLLLYLISAGLNLDTLGFIMKNVLATGVLALIIVFQPELRRILEHMAQTRLSSFNLFAPSLEEQEQRTAHLSSAIEVVCKACEYLSINKTGALIVFERKTRLGEIIKTGTVVDAAPSFELICNIFFVNTPLHDGAMIMRDGRVFAAGCFLPLSENYTISKQMGTRHRAALGMSENSDAIVIIVSEETGIISLAQAGKIERRFTINSLEQRLKKEVLMIEESHQGKKGFWKVKK